MNSLSIFLVGFAFILGSQASAQSSPDFQVHSAPTADLSSDTPKHSITADLNGDGLDDFAVLNTGSSSGGGAVAIQLSDGSGDMGDDHPFDTAGQATGFAMADFDNDGDLDFVAVGGGTFVSIILTVHFNDGSGEYGFAVNSFVVLGPGFGTSGGIAAGDFNEDGFADVAVAHGQNGNGDRMEIYYGDGLGGFTLAGPAFLVRQGSMLQAGDLNADGHLDLVLPSKILFGAGDGSFPTETALSSGGKFTLADADADGDLDILTPSRINPSASVSWNDGLGQFLTFSSVLAPWNVWDLKAADVNLDGIMDLVACGSDVFHTVNEGGVFFGVGNGGYWPIQTFAAGTDPQTIAVGDWDNDGFQDFAVCSGRIQNPIATTWIQDPSNQWTDLGFALDGTSGTPQLSADGTDAGSPFHLQLSNALPSSNGWFVLGPGQVNLSFFSGILVPEVFLRQPMSTDVSGASSLSLNWPIGFSTGFRIYGQAVILDAGSSNGVLSLSNAVNGIQR